MNRSERNIPGTVVSPAEINDLVRQLREIYTHLGTNARHLATLEAKAERLKAQVEALLPAPEQEPEEVVDDVVEETPPAEEEDVAEPAHEEPE